MTDFFCAAKTGRAQDINHLRLTPESEGVYRNIPTTIYERIPALIGRALRKAFRARKLARAKRYLWERGIKPWTDWA